MICIRIISALWYVVFFCFNIHAELYNIDTNIITSVAGPFYFNTASDPDPWIRTMEKRVRIQPKKKNVDFFIIFFLLNTQKIIVLECSDSEAPQNLCKKLIIGFLNINLFFLKGCPGQTAGPTAEILR